MIRSVGSSWFPQLSHWSPRASGVAADRARALDVPVGERVPRGGGERDEHLALDDRAVLVQRPEQILDDELVVVRRRAREQVVGEAEPLEVLAKRLVVVVGDLTDRLPFLVGGHHHRRTVLVRSAHHEDVVPAQPVIAGEHVRRDAEARHVAKVAMSRRIRPGRCDEDLPSPGSHRGQSYERVAESPAGGAPRAATRARARAPQRQASEGTPTARDGACAVETPGRRPARRGRDRRGTGERRERRWAAPSGEPEIAGERSVHRDRAGGSRPTDVGARTAVAADAARGWATTTLRRHRRFGSAARPAAARPPIGSAQPSAAPRASR